jgi:hypothetical protein
MAGEWLAVAAVGWLEIDQRGWCDYHCENCGKWLGYAPDTGSAFVGQLCDAGGGQ